MTIRQREPTKALFLNFKLSQSFTKLRWRTFMFVYRIKVMVFNTTSKKISAISWRSDLLVEETGVNHRPVASHWQTLSHNVLSSTPRHEWGSNSQLKWWYATFAQVVVIRNSSRLSPNEKTSSDMNSILCTAWLMKSHDITMEDRHPRNVGFSHQGYA